MEITRYDPRKNALENAKEEFDAFRRKVNAPAESNSVSAAAVETRPSERVFHCATDAAMRARLVLKLTSETAEIVAVRPAALGDYIQKPSGGQEEAILIERRLILGVYAACPHCASTGLVLCSSCGTLSCLGPDEGEHRCPSCRRTAALSFSGIALSFAAPSARTYTTAPAGKAQALTRQPEPKLLSESPVLRVEYKK